MQVDKKKLLGQFFSGSKIADMIETLVPSQSVNRPNVWHWRFTTTIL